MAISLEQFVKNLTDSGLMSTGEVSALTERLPDDKRPDDAQSLARVLVQQKKLTKFQATAVYKGDIQGLVFGEYVVLDEIGAGGMGQVFEARHRTMERIVALKLLPPKAVDTPDAVERFHKEVRAAARLTHPNIVIAYDAGQQNGHYYLVMEFVDGQDLSRIVCQHGPLPLEQAVECIIQAARGLKYAHEQGIVHRDIKPGNLLLSKDGTVKILDMGLARLAGSQHELGEAGATAQRQLTQTGQMMGTVDYMAPEQAEDTRTADHRADIYSLGCTLYRLLTGSAVYECDTIMQRLLSHREGEIPSLCAARPDVPQALDEAFARMIAKRPDDRYPSMAKVIEVLETAASPGRQAIRGPEETSPDSALKNFFVNLGATQVSTVKPKTNVAAETIEWPTWVEDTADRIKQPAAKEDLLVAAPLETGATSPAAKQRLIRLRAERRLWLVYGPLVLGAGLLAALVLVLSSSDPQRTADQVSNTSQPQAPGASIATVTDASPIVNAPFDADTAKRDQQARADYALEFDGVNSRVGIPTLRYDGSHPITIETWVTPSQRSGVKTLVSNMNNIGGLSLEDWVDGRWQGSLRDAKRFYHTRADEKVVLDKRQHVALVLDEGRYDIFVDGNKQNQPHRIHDLSSGRLGPTNTSPRYVDSGDPFAIGAMARGTTNRFEGMVHELRISKTVRYTRDFVPPAQFKSDDDTLALYQFNEGKGEVLLDSSGHGHDGEIYQAKWIKVSVDDGTSSLLTHGVLRPGHPPVHLLPLVRIPEDVAHGSWSREGDAIVVAPEQGQGARVMLPFELAGSYEMSISFTRVGAKKPIDIQLPVASTGCQMSFSSMKENNYDGFGNIKNLGVQFNASGRSPTAVESGTRHTAKVRVLVHGYRATIEADLDDRMNYLNWSGPQSDLSVFPFFRLPNPKRGSIGGFSTRAKFHDVTLRMLDGEARLVRPEDAAKLHNAQSPPPNANRSITE